MSSQMKITLVKSYIGCTKTQRATLQSLGLKKIRQSVALESTPSNLAAVDKVRHLLHIEEL